MKNKIRIFPIYLNLLSKPLNIFLLINYYLIKNRRNSIHLVKILNIIEKAANTQKTVS